MDMMKKFGSLIIFSLGLLSLTKGQQVSIVPSDQQVKKVVNDSYFVSCILQGGSTDAEWFSPQGRKVDSAPQARIRSEVLNGVELFLNRITTQDVGKYECRSMKSKHSASFHLTVVRPITFDNSNAEQWAEDGRNHLLKCKATGHGSPTIHWRVDNRNINSNSSKYHLLKDGLLIHNVSRQDAAKSYVCRAVDISSPIPDSKLLNISLRVKIKPKIIGTSSPEHFGVLNEWANLTCAVNAEPKPIFQWRYKSQTLTPSDMVVITTEDNVSTLQVLVRSEHMFGIYTCHVRNEMGHDERRVSLLKGRKPPVPRLEVIQVGSHAAKIRVNVPTSTRAHSEQDDKKLGRVLPITGIKVQFKMLAKHDWSPANITPFDDNKAFLLQGLLPKLTYNVRAALKNQAALGDYSGSQFLIKTTEYDFPLTAGASLHQWNVYHKIFSVLGVLFNFVLVNVLL